MLAEQSGSAHNLQIRRCERSDIMLVLQILTEAPEASAWSAAAFDEVCSCDGGLSLIAESSGELVGFAVARRVADEGEILNFAVKKQHRRRGIGERLLENLLQRLHEQGAIKVFLEVRESNAAAIAFYHQSGFYEVGRRAAYYQRPDEAAVVMQAELRRNLPSKAPASNLS